MGALYRAEDPARSNTRVLLHLVEKKYFQLDFVAARYEEWSKELAGLHHPSLLACQSYHTGRENHAVVYGDFEGITLAKYLGTIAVPDNQIDGLISQLISVLRYASDSGITHLQVNPVNILINPQTLELKLFNFFFNTSAWTNYLTSLPVEYLTNDAFTVLSAVDNPAPTGDLSLLNYKSPEQVEGMAVDLRTDIYSTGILLFRLATGELPYQYVNSESEYSQLLLSLPAEQKLNQYPLLKERYSDLIRLAVQQDPANRFQNYLSFTRVFDPESAPALPPVVQGPANDVAQPSTPSGPENPALNTASALEKPVIKRRNPNPVVIGAIVVLISAITLYFLYFRKPKWDTAAERYCIVNIKVRTDTTTWDTFLQKKKEDNVVYLLQMGESFRVLPDTEIAPWARVKLKNNREGLANSDYFITPEENTLLGQLLSSDYISEKINNSWERRSLLNYCRPHSNNIDTRGYESEWELLSDFSGLRNTFYEGSENFRGYSYIWVILRNSKTNKETGVLFVYNKWHQQVFVKGYQIKNRYRDEVQREINQDLYYNYGHYLILK